MSSDFCAYKQTCFLITAITYRAIPYSPVSSEYEKLYIKLCDDNAIDIQNIQIHRTGDFADLIKPKWTFDLDRFSAIEVEVLVKVAKAFKSKSTKEVVDISHRKAAWSENESERNNINYQQFAFLITYFIDQPFSMKRPVRISLVSMGIYFRAPWLNSPKSWR
ncbi:MAG: Panacea domain-containing protein [Sphingobacteriales bacterium]